MITKGTDDEPYMMHLWRQEPLDSLLGGSFGKMIGVLPLDLGELPASWVHSCHKKASLLRELVARLYKKKAHKETRISNFLKAL